VCRDEFHANNPDLKGEREFYNTLRTEHGIAVHYNENGMLLPQFDILDERKYTMFKIRFSS
jgi:hypothetical protein